MSNFGRECWSDGYGVLPIALEDGKLCRCKSCFQYFWQADCHTLEVLEKGSAAEGKAISEMKYLPFLRNEDLEACLKSSICTTDLDALLLVRRRYMMFLNHPFRAHYRECMTRNRRDLIVFAPTPKQVDNMKALLDIYKKSALPNSYDMAELHRDLGETDEALACIALPNVLDQHLAVLLKEHILTGCHGPFRYGHPPAADVGGNTEPIRSGVSHGSWWQRLVRSWNLTRHKDEA